MSGLGYEPRNSQRAVVLRSFSHDLMRETPDEALAQGLSTAVPRDREQERRRGALSAGWAALFLDASQLIKLYDCDVYNPHYATAYHCQKHTGRRADPLQTKSGFSQGLGELPTQVAAGSTDPVSRSTAEHQFSLHGCTKGLRILA